MENKYLTKLRSKLKKYNIYAFDIETYSDLNLFLMGSISNETETKVFWNKIKFIEYIYSLITPENNIIIFATNLGFDISALFENTKYFDDIKFIIRGSDVIGAKIFLEDGKTSISFCDTMNFSHFSVEKLGEIINLVYNTTSFSKLKKPDCLSYIPKTNEDFEELEKYNIQDTKITLNYAIFLQKSFNKLNCDLCMTIASTAMNLFRRNFLMEEILTPPKEELETFQEAYFGGRTEIFKRGNVSNLFYYDFNSLYPSQYFKDYPNPNFIKISENGEKEFLNYDGISYVELESNNSLIPFLPLRNKKDKKLIFPNGIIKGHYSNVEIRYALNLGYKLNKIGKCIYYTKTIKFFKDYGEKLYNLRLKYKKEKNPQEIVIKLLLNSLYGKFAQKYYNTEVINLNKITWDEFQTYIKKENADFNIVGNFGYLTDYEGYIPNFINPIISIYITAYARITLYNMFKTIGLENIYYCDTDSIITDKKIKTSTELGDLKLEYDIKLGVLVKPKMYAFITRDGKEVVKSKGIPVFYNQQFKYKFFIDCLYNPVISYTKFTKFKESNRSNAEYKKGFLKYNEKQEIKKIIGLEDDKRIWKNKFNITELQESLPIIKGDE